LAETEGPVRHLVAAPDGDTVAAFGFGEIAVYSAAGHERLSMRVFDAPAAALAISSDGEWIAALDGTGRAFVFDRLGGRPYWSDPAGAGGSEAIAFHPDSLRLVCLQRDGGIRLRDVRTGA
jgi:WD40 repeat protein